MLERDYANTVGNIDFLSKIFKIWPSNPEPQQNLKLRSKECAMSEQAN